MSLRSHSIKVMIMVVVMVIVVVLAAVYGYFFNDRLKKYLPQDSYLYMSLMINDGDFQNTHLKQFLIPFVDYDEVNAALSGQLSNTGNRNLAIANVMFNNQREVVGVAELKKAQSFPGFVNYKSRFILNNVNKRAVVIFSSNEELLEKTVSSVDLDRIVIKKLNLSSWKSFLSLFSKSQGEVMLTKNENLPIILNEVGKLNGKIIFNLEWGDKTLRLFTPGYELSNNTENKAAPIQAKLSKDSSLSILIPEEIEKAKISEMLFKSNNNYSNFQSTIVSGSLTIEEILAFLTEKLLLANRQTKTVVLPDGSVIKVIQKDEETISIEEVFSGYALTDLIHDERYLLINEEAGKFNLSKGVGESLLLSYVCQINNPGDYLAIDDPNQTNQLTGFITKAVINTKASLVTTYPQVSVCFE